MSENTETTPPVALTGKGVSASWSGVFRLLAWSLPLVATAAVMYLSSLYATHEEVQKAVAPLGPMSEQVHELSRYRADRERVEERAQLKIDAMQTSITMLTTQQTETDKKIDRILDYLERRKTQ